VGKNVGVIKARPGGCPLLHGLVHHVLRPVTSSLPPSLIVFCTRLENFPSARRFILARSKNVDGPEGLERGHWEPWSPPDDPGSSESGEDAARWAWVGESVICEASWCPGLPAGMEAVATDQIEPIGQRRGPDPRLLLKARQPRRLSALMGQTERVARTHPDDPVTTSCLPESKGWRSHARPHARRPLRPALNIAATPPGWQTCSKPDPETAAFHDKIGPKSPGVCPGLGFRRPFGLSSTSPTHPAPETAPDY